MSSEPVRMLALGIVRWAASAAAAVVGCLAVLKAPTHRLWLAAILVTEWGYALAPLALAPLLRPWRRLLGWSAWPLAAAGAAAASPLARALPVARGLPRALAGAFGPAAPRALPGAPARPAPLVPADLIRGVRLPAVRRDRLTYAERGRLALALDLYRPLAPPPAPLPIVVAIHGGGWESGDSRQLPEIYTYLAARGYAVASIGYRLAPDHRFPAAYDDALAAVAYLRRRAADLGLDAGRLALYGRSAGGHLALLAGYAGGIAARGVVALYPPTDMRWGYAHPANPAVIDTRGVLHRFLGGGPEDAPAAYDAASPIRFVGPATPPTLLIHGGRDELVSPVNCLRLAERLAAAGRPHMLLALPWATHGCEANLAGPSGQLILYTVEHFLARVMA